jgi:hypothetical protein
MINKIFLNKSVFVFVAGCLAFNSLFVGIKPSFAAVSCAG